jgi:hypothetical protein
MISWWCILCSSALESMQLTNYCRSLPCCSKGICQRQGTLAMSKRVCVWSIAERHQAVSWPSSQHWPLQTSEGNERGGLLPMFSRVFKTFRAVLIESHGNSVQGHWFHTDHMPHFWIHEITLHQGRRASGWWFPFILKLAAQQCKGDFRRWPLDVSGFSRSRRAWRRSLLPLSMTNELQLLNQRLALFSLSWARESSRACDAMARHSWKRTKCATDGIKGSGCTHLIFSGFQSHWATFSSKACS